jgi:hypothetical protein
VYRGEFDLALRLDEDLLCLSRQRNDSPGLVLGHQSFGRNLFFVGRFTSSRSHLEEALALYDPISHRSLGDQVGAYPHVGAQAYLGNVLFCLGYPDQALERSSAAIAEARRLAHPPSVAGNIATGIRLRLLVGDDAALGEWVDQLVAVTTEQGFPHWRAVGTIFRGWVKVKNGDVAEGISLLRSGSAASRATGAWIPHNIALLAATCEIAGQIEEALTPAVLIDYGDVGNGPASLDAITLELCLLFHPQRIDMGGWPTLEQAKQWGSLDAYLDGCPAAEFTRECRAWATRVAAGQREIAASAYAYLFRQLKYADTNKVLALALLAGIKIFYDQT